MRRAAVVVVGAVAAALGAAWLAPSGPAAAPIAPPVDAAPAVAAVAGGTAASPVAVAGEASVPADAAAPIADAPTASVREAPAAPLSPDDPAWQAAIAAYSLPADARPTAWDPGRVEPLERWRAAQAAAAERAKDPQAAPAPARADADYHRAAQFQADAAGVPVGTGERAPRLMGGVWIGDKPPQRAFDGSPSTPASPDGNG